MSISVLELNLRIIRSCGSTTYTILSLVCACNTILAYLRAINDYAYNDNLDNQDFEKFVKIVKKF